MKEIKRLPPLDWTDRAKRQIGQENSELLLSSSHVAYQLGNAAVIGLVYSNLLSPPWLWFALAKNITLRDLIDFRRMQEQIPKGTITGVEADDKEALRFAAFYGFAEAGKLHASDGVDYILMRKK